MALPYISLSCLFCIFLSAFKETDGEETLLDKQIGLVAKLQNKHISKAVISILIKACPEAVKKTTYDNSTPLHVALQYDHTTEAVVAALLTAWPEAVNEKDHSGKNPLDYGILPGIPAEVVAEHRLNLPDDGAMCRSYLSEGNTWTLPHSCLGWMRTRVLKGIRLNGCKSRTSMAILHSR